MSDVKSRKATVKARIGDLAGFAVGGVLGLLGSAYSRYRAQAAVDVRPGLADVGFVEALVTNHGEDWLFYHFPMVGTVLLTVLMALVIGIGWQVMTR